MPVIAASHRDQHTPARHRRAAPSAVRIPAFAPAEADLPAQAAHLPPTAALPPPEDAVPEDAVPEDAVPEDAVPEDAAARLGLDTDRYHLPGGCCPRGPRRYGRGR